MNLAPLQGKQLDRIQQVAEQLLLALNASGSGHALIRAELCVLMIEINHERQLRSDKAVMLFPLNDSAIEVDKWDNEGGALHEAQPVFKNFSVPQPTEVVAKTDV